MRKNIVAGNWKMNLVSSEAKKLVSEIKKFEDKNVEMIVFPSSVFLQETLSEADGQ